MKQVFTWEQVKPVEVEGREAVAYMMRRGSRKLLCRDDHEKAYTDTLLAVIRAYLERGRRVFVIEPISRAELRFVELLLLYAREYGNIRWYAFFRFEAAEEEFLTTSDELTAKLRESVTGTGHLYSGKVTPKAGAKVSRQHIETQRRHYQWLAKNCAEMLGCMQSDDPSLPAQICDQYQIPYFNMFPDIQDRLNGLKPTDRYHDDVIRNFLYLNSRSVKKTYYYRAQSPDLETYLLRYSFVSGIRMCYPPISANRMLANYLRPVFPPELEPVAAFYLDAQSRNKLIYTEPLRRAVKRCLEQGKRVFVSDVCCQAHEIFLDILLEYAPEYPDIHFYGYFTNPKDETRFRSEKWRGLLCGSDHFTASQKGDLERMYLEKLTASCSVLIGCCQNNRYRNNAEICALEAGIPFYNIAPEVGYSVEQAIIAFDHCQKSFALQESSKRYRHQRMLHEFIMWYGFLSGVAVGRPGLDMNRFRSSLSEPQATVLERPEIESLLRRMGFTENTPGYREAAECIDFCSHRPGYLKEPSKVLFHDLAAYLGQDEGDVVKIIRTGIAAVWQDDRAAMFRTIGIGIWGTIPPSVKAFLEGVCHMEDEP